MEQPRVRNLPQGLRKAVSARLYSVKQLKQCSVATNEFIAFYLTCLRGVIMYASPVFHNSLSSCLSDGLEGLQKHAIRNFLHVSFQDLGLSNLETPFVRRQVQTVKTFQDISFGSKIIKICTRAKEM